MSSVSWKPGAQALAVRVSAQAAPTPAALMPVKLTPLSAPVRKPRDQPHNDRACAVRRGGSRSTRDSKTTPAVGGAGCGAKTNSRGSSAAHRPGPRPRPTTPSRGHERRRSATRPQPGARRRGGPRRRATSRRSAAALAGARRARRMPGGGRAAVDRARAGSAGPPPRAPFVPLPVPELVRRVGTATPSARRTGGRHGGRRARIGRR